MKTLSLDLSVGTLTGFSGQHDANVLQVAALKKLRMPRCVRTADIHEHTAGEVPHRISTRAVGRPTGQGVPGG